MSDINHNLFWYIARDGQQHGPLSDDEMRLFVNKGHLKDTDFVWNQNAPNWQPAPSVFPTKSDFSQPPLTSTSLPKKDEPAAHALGAPKSATPPNAQQSFSAAQFAGDKDGDKSASVFPASFANTLSSPAENLRSFRTKNSTAESGLQPTQEQLASINTYDYEDPNCDDALYPGRNDLGELGEESPNHQNSLIIAARQNGQRHSSGEQRSNRGSLYKFSFYSTLICWIVAIPLSFASVLGVTLTVNLFGWLHSVDGMNTFSWEYWLFGWEYKESYLAQMLMESFLAFLREFIAIAVGLLFTFWCFIKWRRQIGWSISVGSIVMFLSTAYMLLGIFSLASNGYYTWKVYEMGILQCNAFSLEFFKCNFSLLELPRVSGALSNIFAAAFAGQVYSQHLDDTDAWVQEVEHKFAEHNKWYGAS